VGLRKEHSINYKIVKSNRQRVAWLEEKWDNSVHIAARLHDGLPRDCVSISSKNITFFLFSEASNQALGPIPASYPLRTAHYFYRGKLAGT